MRVKMFRQVLEERDQFWVRQGQSSVANFSWVLIYVFLIDYEKVWRADNSQRRLRTVWKKTFEILLFREFSVIHDNFTVERECEVVYVFLSFKQFSRHQTYSSNRKYFSTYCFMNFSFLLSLLCFWWSNLKVGSRCLRRSGFDCKKPISKAW